MRDKFSFTYCQYPGPNSVLRGGKMAFLLIIKALYQRCLRMPGAHRLTFSY